MDAVVSTSVDTVAVVESPNVVGAVMPQTALYGNVSYPSFAATPVTNPSLFAFVVGGPPGPIGPPGSGVLNLTGQYPIFYDAGSGVVGIVSGYYVTFPDLTSASGAIVAQISAAAAGVNAINGLSGFLTLSAVNPIYVTMSGQTLFISGSGLATSGDINGLSAQIASLSGYVNTQIAALSGYTNTLVATTGQQAWNAAQGNAVNLSGNIGATGSYLYSLITGNTGTANLSGYLTTGQADLRYYPLASNPSGYITSGQTGQFYAASNPQHYATTGDLQATGTYLYSLITGGNTGVVNVSGYITTGDADNRYYPLSGNPSGYVSTGAGDLRYYPLATNPAGYVTTGQSGQFYPSSNPQGYATSGDLAQTGQQALAYANGIGINLSGNLQSTGSNLQTQINAINAGTGGITVNVVYTSGTQFISGTKYFLGSTYIDNLFVTGQQTVINTQDLYVGDNWIVMNATGGARDSALFISTGFTGVAATGAVMGWDVPSNTWRFGLASQQTDLFTLPRVASGEAVDALELRLTQSGVIIEGQIAALSGFVTGVSGYNESIYVKHNTDLVTGRVAIVSNTGSITDNIAFRFETGLGCRLVVASNSSAATGVSRLGGSELVSFVSAGNLIVHAHANSSVVDWLSRRTNGSYLSPTSLLSGNTITRFVGGGYDGSVYQNRVSMIYRVSEDWNSTGQGTDITFSTTANGTTNTLERVVIGNSGNVGIGVTNPSALLHVNGSTILSGTVIINGVVSGLSGFDIPRDTAYYQEGKLALRVVKRPSAPLDYHIMVGSESPVTSGLANTFIGAPVGKNFGLPAPNYTIAIGNSDTLSDLRTGSENTVIGDTSFSRLQIGNQNTTIGGSIAPTATGAYGNIAMGNYTLNVMKSGSQNIAIGRQAGGQLYFDGVGFSPTGLVTGNNNILIGHDVIPTGLASDGYLNIANSIFGSNLYQYTGSKIGICHRNPQFNLHVSGDVGLASIATTSTANAGAATLPANPVGFITINITGANFKIPYYNL